MLMTGAQNVSTSEGPCSGVMLRIQPAEPAYVPWQVLFTLRMSVANESERAIMWHDVPSGLKLALSFEETAQCLETLYARPELFPSVSSHCLKYRERINQMRLVTPESQANEMWRANNWPTGHSVPYMDFLCALKRKARGNIDDVETYIRYVLFCM